MSAASRVASALLVWWSLARRRRRLLTCLAVSLGPKVHHIEHGGVVGDGALVGCGRHGQRGAFAVIA